MAHYPGESCEDKQENKEAGGFGGAHGEGDSADEGEGSGEGEEYGDGAAWGIARD